MNEQAIGRYKEVTEQKWFTRLLDVIPGLVSWTLILAPIALSIWRPVLVAYFIIAFDLYWLIKAIRLSIFLVRGYGRLHQAERVNWQKQLDWLEHPDHHLQLAERRRRDLLAKHPKAGAWFQFSPAASREHLRYRQVTKEIANLRSIIDRQSAILPPSEVYQLVIIATYNESREILESSVRSLLEVDYPLKQIMLVLAYEERGPESTRQAAQDLVQKYGKRFALAQAIGHPDRIPGEIRGKGGNITHAGRQVAEYIASQQIDPERVIVTTLDADHRPHPLYFAYLTYLYCDNPNRIHKSYQPVPMFYNNIWDAPAPMRVIATGNSFWLLMETMRPHRLRNFAAHAQSLRALIDTDFWSVTTIVEDGHQYWRSYFAFDGDHQVVPVYIPIYQDAVLADTYPKTFKAQYKQLRRWGWGVSDFSYVVTNFIRNQRISLLAKIQQTWRLFEGHVSWATASLIVTFVAWLPLYLNQQFSHQELAHQLPVIASRLMSIATIGLIITVAISMISLPPKPPRYGQRRRLAMLIQWALLPITSILFGSLASLDAQTRLMFGRYLEFQVTDKSRK